VEAVAAAGAAAATELRDHDDDVPHSPSADAV